MDLELKPRVLELSGPTSLKLGGSDSRAALQSLVVCPTTLGGHWLEEVGRFVGRQYLRPFLYYGSPTVRASLRPKVPLHNLIITSYDILRNDVEFLSAIQWNYVVLDEGHVIKNSKSKTFQVGLMRNFVPLHYCGILLKNREDIEIYTKFANC
jgi:SNF2 family DNA or RNA helicase